MATISAPNNEKVYSISKWGGLNEHPDGDTRLKIGEASKMVNWKITRDGNLKRRPGMRPVIGLRDSYLKNISASIQYLATYQSETETLEVFTGATIDLIPGIVVLTGPGGTVKDGVYSGIRAKIKDGDMIAEEGNAFVAEAGILTVAGAGEIISIEELQTRLAALEPGSYLYVEVDESPFALNADCLIEQHGEYRLGGYLVTADPADGARLPVQGLWSGYINGKKCMLAACNDAVYNIYDPDDDVLMRETIGTLNTDKGVNFIPFDDKVYIQNGYEYYVYDGTNFEEVEGYRPLIAISIGPTGTSDAGGELTGEYINRLNGLRRVWISPDGTNKTFMLPESNLAAVDYLMDLTTGEKLTTGWSADTTAGTVTFTTAPARSVNSYEIGYSVSETLRDDVTAMLYAELYSGQTDTGLFFYGDGTNRVIYTGMDYYGQARADYFPDLYEARVGDSNAPVSSLTRHGGVLLAYKPGGECWAMSYGSTQLATGDLTVAVYIQPINKEIGNDVMGHVQLVNNNPITCCNGELYQWKNSSYYTSNLTRDERQAMRITDRIQKSIKEMDFSKCVMWDDNDNQEFYITQGGIALVWNYAADAWYRYENFDAVKLCAFQGEVLMGTSDGKLLLLTYNRLSDQGIPIEAEWESGAIDFGVSHLRKYSSMLWVGLKPEEGTSVDVCVETDRKNTFREKIVSSTKAKVPGEPFMVRSKIKAKKFVYYRLLLSTKERIPAVTVTNVDFRVRQTGYAK